MKETDIQKRISKYRSKKTTVYGIKFDSIKEANRYIELMAMQKAGIIYDLEIQPSFEIAPSVKWNGITLRKRIYRADFRYVENESGDKVVEDCKGYRTREYTLKRQLFLLNYKEYVFKET